MLVAALVDKEGSMSKYDGARKALNGAGTGLAVAVAFLNVALLIVQLVKTVTEENAVAEDNE